MDVREQEGELIQTERDDGARGVWQVYRVYPEGSTNRSKSEKGTELPISVRHVACSLMLLVLATSWQPADAEAQTDASFVQSEETHYYDFWPGTWVQVVDGVVDTSATIFTVRRSVNSAAFHETWRQVYDGRSRRSVGLRSWDQVNERWMFVWVSDNALFQVWEGQRIEDQWYMVKEFEVDGGIFFSRQSWIPTGNDQLTRTIERSTDGGRTWVVRIRESYRRVGD